MPLPPSSVLDYVCNDGSKDAWDGYRANRNRILDHLYNNEISNTVILSGDSHANWVSDLAREYISMYNLTQFDVLNQHKISTTLRRMSTRLIYVTDCADFG